MRDVHIDNFGDVGVEAWSLVLEEGVVLLESLIICDTC